MLCNKCNQDFLPRVCGQNNALGGSMLYGTLPDGSVHCEKCCGDDDREWMVAHGKITLYLNFPCNPRIGRGASKQSRINIKRLYFNEGDSYVSNWPSSLKFKLRNNCVIAGNHNFAGIRYDVWFNGPDGHIWHGTQYGDFTQICHCKRTKERWI